MADQLTAARRRWADTLAAIGVGLQAAALVMYGTGLANRLVAGEALACSIVVCVLGLIIGREK